MWQSTSPGIAQRPRPSTSSTSPSSAGRSRIRPALSIRPSIAEDVGILDHLDLAERAAAERRVAAGGRGELREVADEQAGQSQPWR